MSETLTINELQFEVRRSKRRKKLGLTVDRFGELVVHAPEQSDTGELRAWVQTKMLWVNQKLLLKDSTRQRVRSLEAVSGETLSYLGRNYRLRICDEQDQPLVFDGHWFMLRRKDRASASLVFQEWYRETGQKWLTGRVKRWERQTGTTPSSISAEELGYRWASCSSSGVLRFNWKLLQLPIRLIDYVIVHELIHLKEHNHSSEFWGMLGQALPDWQSRKDELAATQPELVWSKEESK